MFHCNGWCFPWTISASPVRMSVSARYAPSRSGRGRGPSRDPPVRCADRDATLLNAQREKRPLPTTCSFITAAAPPPEPVLAAWTDAGFAVTHLYGLTETYGPAVVNEWHAAWNALARRTGARKRRARACVTCRWRLSRSWIPHTMQPVPADGETLGEVMFRGNMVMKGY